MSIYLSIWNNCVRVCLSVFSLSCQTFPVQTADWVRSGGTSAPAEGSAGTTTGTRTSCLWSLVLNGGSSWRIEIFPHSKASKMNVVIRHQLLLGWFSLQDKPTDTSHGGSGREWVGTFSFNVSYEGRGLSQRSVDHPEPNICTLKGTQHHSVHLSPSSRCFSKLSTWNSLSIPAVFPSSQNLNV